MINRSFLIISLFVIFSCENYFVPKNSEPIARIDQDYLYIEDIESLIELVRQKVFEMHNVKLDLELKIVGETNNNG